MPWKRRRPGRCRTNRTGNPQRMAAMICRECDGSGWVERVSWHGPYEAPCTNCYESLGEVPDEEPDDSNDSRGF